MTNNTWDVTELRRKLRGASRDELKEFLIEFVQTLRRQRLEAEPLHAEQILGQVHEGTKESVVGTWPLPALKPGEPLPADFGTHNTFVTIEMKNAAIRRFRHKAYGEPL